jgi:transposase
VAEAEIITRRRKWTPEQEATLLAEVDAEGGRVSVVAKRRGLAESLLYNWRAADKAVAATCSAPCGRSSAVLNRRSCRIS